MAGMRPMLQIQSEAMRRFIHDDYTVQELEELQQLLDAAGTFDFVPLNNGLFPAALALQEDYEYTGYSNVWVRDNVLVSYGQYASGRKEAAVECMKTLAEYFWKYRTRFERIIAGQDDPDNPMLRPHIRIDGNTLSEIDQQWAHAQNDALGYFLWFYCQLIRNGDIAPADVQAPLLTLFVDYLSTIRFWEDEDSGHWEEVRKIAASSVGTATAGLLELSRLYDAFPQLVSQTNDSCAYFDRLEAAITHGKTTLQQILPSECIQPDPQQRRDVDAALLFLIEPLRMVSGSLADRILADVNTHLVGDYGIRRYIGDSYWCADYKDKLSPEKRTNDFSEDQSARDALLTAGQEAQWCIFDPVLSVIYGRRFQESGLPEDRQQQIHYFHRALAQLTGENSPFGALRCPESYYLVQGEYVPNDITPLLWTQANLLQALFWMRHTTT